MPTRDLRVDLGPLNPRWWDITPVEVPHNQKAPIPHVSIARLLFGDSSRAVHRISLGLGNMDPRVRFIFNPTNPCIGNLIGREILWPA
jgi:hypothetical protein